MWKLGLHLRIFGSLDLLRVLKMVDKDLVVDSEFIKLKEDGVDFLLWKKKQRSYLYTEEPFLPILSGHKKIRLEDTQTKNLSVLLYHCWKLVCCSPSPPG